MFRIEFRHPGSMNGWIPFGLTSRRDLAMELSEACRLHHPGCECRIHEPGPGPALAAEAALV